MKTFNNKLQITFTFVFSIMMAYAGLKSGNEAFYLLAVIFLLVCLFFVSNHGCRKSPLAK